MMSLPIGLWLGIILLTTELAACKQNGQGHYQVLLTNVFAHLKWHFCHRYKRLKKITKLEISRIRDQDEGISFASSEIRESGDISVLYLLIRILMMMSSTIQASIFLSLFFLHSLSPITRSPLF